MPLYEYQCLNCEKIHEVLQQFSDTPLEQCPDCKGKIKKLMSLSSFSLKGSGWYVTDYKKGTPTLSKPETTKPEATKPETTKPEATKPETTKPDPVHTKAPLKTQDSNTPQKTSPPSSSK
jgi:putative FmdB family regulatory protein